MAWVYCFNLMLADSSLEKKESNNRAQSVQVQQKLYVFMLHIRTESMLEHDFSIHINNVLFILVYHFRLMSHHEINDFMLYKCRLINFFLICRGLLLRFNVKRVDLNASCLYAYFTKRTSVCVKYPY